ncbi:MAG: heme NO-binding domain-containing protein [Porticoccaceae bacterium]
MKAILFQSFLDLVEAQYGADTLDGILADVDAPSGGIYTASGDYSHIELIELIVALSKRTHLSVSNLTKSFGMYHFAEYIAAYPQLFTDLHCSFELLEKVDSFIHKEVQALYLGAKPPKFEFSRKSQNTIELIYHSHRCMGDVAEGLILGCAAYYGEKINIKRETLGDGSGSIERFLLTQQFSNMR